MIETRLKMTMAKMPLSIALQEQAAGSKGQKVKFTNPNMDNYESNIRACAERGLPVVRANSLEAKSAVVCGSGPSLRDPMVLQQIKGEQKSGAVVFACKAAISYLMDHHIRVDYGVSMDPGAHIADPRKIKKVPGVKHIIASTSDPELFDYLLGDEFGEPAEVLVFHSATGFQRVIPYADEDQWNEVPEVEKEQYETLTEDGAMYHVLGEMHLYSELFGSEPESIMGGGFNVVNRAISLSMYMGAERIVLAGVDCGWRDEAEMYCDGPAHRPGIDMKDKGVVDGKNWNTRPDMLASAVSLAKLAKSGGPGKFVIIGDTLPASLSKKDDDFLNKVASF